MLQLNTNEDTSSLVTSETSSDASSSVNSSTSGHYRIKLSQMADRKMVIVPVVYLLLKFWGLTVDFFIYFVSTDAKTTYRENALSSVLVFIAVSNCTICSKNSRLVVGIIIS